MLISPIGSSAALRIITTGRFRVLGPGDVDLTPKPKKAQALLALLALSQNHERSKLWLQRMLWSRQEEEQSYGSLRQAIVAIRRSLGLHGDVIQMHAGLVSLDPSRLCVEQPIVHGLGDIDPTLVLHGLDILEPEFQAWLAAQRRIFGEAARGPVHGSSETLRLHLKRLDGRTAELGELSCLIGDQIGQMVADQAGATIVAATDGGPLAYQDTDLVLRSGILETSDRIAIRLRVEQATDGAMIWSGVETVSAAGLQALTQTSVQRLINTATDAVLNAFAALPDDAAMALRSAHRLFAFDQAASDEADAAFAGQHAGDPKGITLAWGAYLRATIPSKDMLDDVDSLRKDAETYANQARRLAPQNSMVHALAAYTHATLLDDPALGKALAEHSLTLNDQTPLAWSILGLCDLLLGAPDVAYDHTEHALSIAGPGPHLLQICIMACQAAAAVGNYDRAISHGHRARAIFSDHAPFNRYFAALLATANRPTQTKG